MRGLIFHQINSKSVGSSIIDVKGRAAESVVPRMLELVNEEIFDPRKKLVRLRYPVTEAWLVPPTSVCRRFL